MIEFKYNWALDEVIELESYRVLQVHELSLQIYCIVMYVPKYMYKLLNVISDLTHHDILPTEFHQLNFFTLFRIVKNASISITVFS